MPTYKITALKEGQFTLPSNTQAPALIFSGAKILDQADYNIYSESIKGLIVAQFINLEIVPDGTVLETPKVEAPKVEAPKVEAPVANKSASKQPIKPSGSI